MTESAKEPQFGMLANMEPNSLSEWTAWRNRSQIPDSDQPGVYLVARFDGDRPVSVDPIDKSIIYVGETCGNSLRTRWGAFNRAVMRGVKGHSGGLTLNANFCKGLPVESETLPWLYVAAQPVLFDEPHRSAYIRFRERQLLWNFVQRYGVLPQCNTK